MNSFREWLVNILRNLANALNSLGSDGPTASDLESQREAFTGGVAEEESRPVPRLRSGQVGIFVNCASCGILHELEAVCHICGSPLCSDTYNCRIMATDPDLGFQAVYCPNCAKL